MATTSSDVPTYFPSRKKKRKKEVTMDAKKLIALRVKDRVTESPRLEYRYQCLDTGREFVTYEDEAVFSPYTGSDMVVSVLSQDVDLSNEPTSVPEPDPEYSEVPYDDAAYMSAGPYDSENSSY